MEVLQLHVPRRSASGLDLLLNVLGATAGAAAGALLGPRRLPTRPGLDALRPIAPVAALLAGSWLAYRLYPFVPALDLGEWRASLSPLLRGSLDPLRVFRLAVLWLVAGRLIVAAWPRGGFLLFLLVVGGVTAAAVPIVDRRLSLDEIAAAAIAVVAWPLFRRGGLWDALLLLLLIAAALADGLSPYRLAAVQREFNWMPFRAVMRGQWGNGLQAVLLKFFTYGGIAWLALQAGLRLAVAAPLTVGLALGVSYAQTFMPTRSAESTDAVLALLAVVLLRVFEPPVRAARRGT
jgi:VanZ family protein